MALVDSVPVNGCHECVALLTLPLALFLLLAETAVGGIATVTYLRITGGLQPGVFQFFRVFPRIIRVHAFLVAVVGATDPPTVNSLLTTMQGLLHGSLGI